MNTEQTQTTVNLFLQSLSQRDLPALTNLFSENIDWYVPGDEAQVPWLGRRSSREELKTFYTLLWRSVAPIAVNVDHIFVEDQAAVITGSFTSKMLPTGKTVDSLFFIQMKIENGLIVKYRLLEDSYAVSVAMTS